MSQEIDQMELHEQTRQLLQGPLKHIRAAALAAALLPLASIAAAPASAQVVCQSAGTVCGFVFDDVNKNGIQDAGETGIEGAKVSLIYGTDTLTAETGSDGFYFIYVPDGTYPIGVLVPLGTQTSPPNVGSDDTLDSDGVPDGFGFSGTTVTVVYADNPDTDFGFFTPSVQQPVGTGTPGYWKNHPEAWPASIAVNGIVVGGHTYTKDEAISALGKVGKDKTYTMFSSLLPAMLNVWIGTNDGCIKAAIKAGNAWMATYGPAGQNVPASSYAWSIGEPTHMTLDAYNNGRLCAPHRQ